MAEAKVRKHVPDWAKFVEKTKQNWMTMDDVEIKTRGGALTGLGF